MKQHCDRLKSAIDLGAVPAAINALVCIADELIERGDTTRAAYILALVLCYPMGKDTRDLAECLFDNLESAICPRVIVDAKARAEEMTLEDLAAEIIGEIAGE